MYFLIPHLRELRIRVLQSIAFFLIVFCICYFFRDKVIQILIESCGVQKLVSIQVFELFLTEIKITFFLSFLISLPYFLLQIWGFVKIALFPKEKIFARSVMLTSLFLFFLL
jgi:sec-independent protein translocase protein TatC